LSKVGLRRMIIGLCLLSGAAATIWAAVTFTRLVVFKGTNGSEPGLISFVQGSDGDLYGTTVHGGQAGLGVVFKITPAGTLTTLHSFAGYPTNGAGPEAGLVLGTDGNFYGTTFVGGASNSRGAGGCGTVFKITPGGTLTTLHSFWSQTGCTDGAFPVAGLVEGTDGNFYGTTNKGGTGSCPGVALACGTVFKITPAGTLTTLHSFDDADGAYPFGALIQATDGNFYGTTLQGGANDDGTVFKITPEGALTTLHAFEYGDGAYPEGGLVQGTDGNFYGTSSYGGANDKGSVFMMTPGGEPTTLYDFCSETKCTDGAVPDAGLIQATDGNLYGTTTEGGSSSNCVNGCGTVFELTSGGTLTILHSFDGTDGDSPSDGLAEITTGILYGTTFGGGADDDGTVFSLSVGLKPFVETDPTSGAVGTKVTILGNTLEGAISVTFNGTAATFKVVSSTEITTTVPSGATTGYVKVKTPSRTLTSNVSFRVP
jgi:uncharacterized repeat protein (TIGR03803 family)